MKGTAQWRQLIGSCRKLGTSVAVVSDPDDLIYLAELWSPLSVNACSWRGGMPSRKHFAVLEKALPSGSLDLKQN